MFTLFDMKDHWRSALAVLIVLAVIPWRYVFSQYVSKQGDRWRSGHTPAVSERP